jgi:diacylglycerol kinase family enzyme
LLIDVVGMRANGFGHGELQVWALIRTHKPKQPGVSGSLVGFARGAEVTLEATPPQPAQLDGEPGGMTPFTATIVPQAIEVLAP